MFNFSLERKVQRRAHASFEGRYSLNSLSSRSKKMFRSFDENELCLRNVSQRRVQDLTIEDEDMMDEEDDDISEVSIPKKPIEIRKTFPETWLWDNLEFKE